MSTLKNNISARRLALLAKTGEQIFHINDLANLWLITNKNTLRVTLKRYCKDDLLHRIYRGFYAIRPIQGLNPVLLGAKAIHQFCYLTTETILYRQGLIAQNIEPLTFVSDSSSKFTIGEHRYVSRQLDKSYLYQPDGVELRDGVLQATLERAVADMLYFNPHYHFDAPMAWQKIRALQKKIGYPLTPARYVTAKTS